MTVEADLTILLQGLVGGRMFPDVAPEGTEAPYIVFQQVGGRSVAFLERAVPSNKHGRYQVAVWAKQRSEAAALGLQIEAAMLTATAFQVEALGAPIADHDSETGLRASRQDFGIWSQR
ncbi:MAG: DUF3168 domain-containing protein [Proteobacteria bacterium]|nr:DUF3168 domain-containing protein [Pseudomonadota bacterium]